jgi:putative restriction endonuclease
MATDALDHQIRQRAFDLLAELSDRFGEVIPFQLLSRGFDFEGTRVPLLGPQRTFRERVLEAYREQCALCRLRHIELLEAAHIRPDSDPEGEPIVSNGLALCKLHHAAFDRNILGIRPDYVVEIRVDILEEIDGPMLRHGLQEMHGSKLVVPRRQEHRPDPAALEFRYSAFRAGT